jgi:hypothetical protein
MNRGYFGQKVYGWKASNREECGDYRRSGPDGGRGLVGIIRPGEIAQIELHMEDEKGRPVPDAEPMIECEVSGAGEYLGMDGGNLLDLSLYREKKRKCLQELCFVSERDRTRDNYSMFSDRKEHQDENFNRGSETGE